jgi:hypothetical protein
MASEMDKDFNAVIGKAKTFATNYETSIKPAIEAAEKLA